MKNAKQYETKLRKLLSGQLRHHDLETPDEPPVRSLLRGILLADATAKQAEAALAALEAEFVDYNEMRVAPLKEIVDPIGRDYPGAVAKAQVLNTALNNLFDRAGGISTDYMQEMGKRDLRRHLLELGLTPFAAAYLLLVVFDAHAVPVDHALVDCLEARDCIHPGSDIEDVQGFLERVINQKDARAAHAFFRHLVEEDYAMVTEKRLAREQVVAEAARARVAEEDAAPPAEEPEEPEAADAPPGDEPAAAARPTTRSAKRRRGGKASGTTGRRQTSKKSRK